MVAYTVRFQRGAQFARGVQFARAHYSRAEHNLRRAQSGGMLPLKILIRKPLYMNFGGL